MSHIPLKIEDLARHLLLWCWLIVVLVGFSALPASAQQSRSLDDLFTIRSLSVDETAASAFAARQRALERAEQAAYDKLLAKLIRSTDRALLPDLTRRELQSMMVGIDFVEEKTSSRRYIATLNVRFEPALVSDFLARHKVPHILETGGKLLLLHAHKRGLKEFLWERDTTLTVARAGIDWGNRIRQLVLPKGEYRTRYQFGFSAVRTLDYEQIDRLLKATDIPSALLISSTIHAEFGTGRTTLIYGFGLSRIGQTYTGEVIVDGTDPEAESRALGIMYSRILDQIDEQWKAQLLVDSAETGQMEVFLATPTHQDYVDLTERLRGISLITSLRIKSIRVPLTTAVFDYRGLEDQLRIALGYAGLELVAIDGGYMLKLARD